MLNLNQPKSFALFVRSAYGDLLMVVPLINFIKQQNALGVLQLLDRNVQSIISELYPKLRSTAGEKNTNKIIIITSVSNNKNSCQLNNITTANILNKIHRIYNIQAVISTLEAQLNTIKSNKQLT
jgi:hypothetical protein